MAHVKIAVFLGMSQPSTGNNVLAGNGSSASRNGSCHVGCDGAGIDLLSALSALDLSSLLAAQATEGPDHLLYGYHAFLAA
jgi:hypothetical protein